MTDSAPPPPPDPVHTGPVVFDDLDLIFDRPAAAAAASDPVGQKMIELLAPHPEGLIILADLGIRIRSSAESTLDRSTPPMIDDRPTRSYAIFTRNHVERDQVVLSTVAVAGIDPAELTRADRVALHRAYLALSTVGRAHGLTTDVAYPTPPTTKAKTP